MSLSDNAFVAQMVERRTFNPVVAGSSPAEGVFLNPATATTTHRGPKRGPRGNRTPDLSHPKRESYL